MKLTKWMYIAQLINLPHFNRNWAIFVTVQMVTVPCFALSILQLLCLRSLFNVLTTWIIYTIDGYIQVCNCRWKMSNIDDTFFIFCLWNIDVIVWYNWAFNIFSVRFNIQNIKKLEYTFWFNIYLTLYLLWEYTNDMSSKV